MELQTIVDIPKGSFQIGHDSKIMLLGSCFADEMGEKFSQSGFTTMANPFGTLYNPASIAALLLRCISRTQYEQTSKEVFQAADRLWHSWMHHSRFSASTAESIVSSLNDATRAAADFLQHADVLIVTLGTAIIYRLKEDGMLVANCHKQPDSLFQRERLSAYDIADQWQMVLSLLHSVNPLLKIIFTVSPIRHKRDGLHINQISKGILLQAVDEIISSAAASADAPPLSYFPSYEIMLDELRDYRFYADDMIHPSPLAVQYIWQRFQDTYMSRDTQEACRQALKEWKRSRHREIMHT